MITVNYRVIISDHWDSEFYEKMRANHSKIRYWKPDIHHDVKITGQDYDDCEKQVQAFVEKLREKNKVYPISNFVRTESGIQEIVPEVEQTKSYHYRIIDENCRND